MARTTRTAGAKYTLPSVVLALGVALSLGLGYVARLEIERNAQTRFDAVATGVARNVVDRFDAYTEVLIGLRALFNTGAVTRHEFREYVSGLRLQQNFPGFRTLNYAPHVSAAQRPAFEAALRRDYGDAGAAVLAIAPPGERSDYYPLAFVEPLRGNETALGKDLGVNAKALAALQTSRDSGALISSGRMIHIGAGKNDIGLAIRLPVYRTGLPQATVEERRAAYLGSVGAGFRVADMVGDVVRADAAQHLRLRLFDGGPGNLPSELRGGDELRSTVPAVVDANLIFDNAGGVTPTPGANFERRLAFDLGGRVWVVEVQQDATLVVGGLDRALPWLIVLCGIAISASLAGVVYSLATSRGRALGIALQMTRHLRISERRLGEAQQLASLGSWILDAQSGTLLCSDEARRIFGFDAEGADVPTLLARIPIEQRAAVEQAVASAQRSGERHEFEHALRLPDGSQRWVHVIVQLSEEDGKTALRGTVRDDTQRHAEGLRLKLEHDIARLLVDEGEVELVIARALEAICIHLGWDCGFFWAVGADGMAHCGPAWTVAHAPALEQFMRISRSLTYGADEGTLGGAWVLGDMICVDTGAAARDFTRDALARQAGLATGVVVPLRGAGDRVALEFFCRKTQASDVQALETLRAVALQIDQYGQRKQAELALRHVASHDALTGLWNRTSLQQSLGRAIKRSDRHQKRLAVVFIDLDRFKQINDTLGHGVGDAMIKACASRLSGVLRAGDGVARFGGDEFVLVLEDLSQASDAAVVAGKVLARCAEPFVIDGHELHVSASVGISVYPEDGRDGETLLKNADTAMYRAKEQGRGGYQFYAAQMNAQGTERLMIESGLRRAIERNELVLHYQPKLDLRTRRITGVEALMRWRHPVLGMVSPAQFIPIAEETGLIDAMGKWALAAACAEARAWSERGLPPLQMSVNLSPRQLNSTTLLADIEAILTASGLEPARLELEITESAMMLNPERAAALLSDIRAMGVRLAMDDFGTGYSSLSYLKRFPLSTVKIDRSFVKDLSQDRDAQALAAGIVALAHGLRMKVVAEGVETAEQLAWLRSNGCDEIQGFMLCKPLPAHELCEFVTQHLRTLFDPAVAA